MSIAAFPYGSFSGPILSAQVMANFDHLRNKWNHATTGAVELSGAQTIADVKTFSATVVFSTGLTVTASGLTVSAGGVTVTGNSTITGTLGGVTTLSCVTMNASGAATVGTTLGVGGNLTMTGGQAIGKRVDDGDSGTALTLDFNTGNIHRVRLTGNCTFTFSNPATGASYFVELLQDTTGTRLATWPATVKWEGGTAPTLTTTVSRKDAFVFFWNGVNYLGSIYGQDYADTT